MTIVDTAVLDNPAWASLRGAHARFARVVGRAARYDPEVAPFHAVSDPAEAGAWADLRALVGPGAELTLTGDDLVAPPGWTLLERIGGVQLVDVALRAEPDPEAVTLTASDVPEMLDLVGRTKPGPFLPRTVELGTYLGIRRGGALIAMAGERLHPPGWTEISAVCTDPAHRGRGLATRLVRAVAAGIRERGETPLLHTAAGNTAAIRLYQELGFRLRRRPTFWRFRAPA
ncbi:GNAT family N-acetyltransferase [Actinoplanes sp. NPDC049668]|uniref:GNAT family N-acetyltransferase n=1 Tax=unclassified Actinoplanes TaxID=2626549 RepID=UPI0033AA8D34